MAEDAGESLSQDSQSSSSGLKLLLYAICILATIVREDLNARAQRRTRDSERPEKRLNSLKMPEAVQETATRDLRSAPKQPFQRRFPKYGFNPKQYDNPKDAANDLTLFWFQRDFCVILSAKVHQGMNIKTPA